MSGELYTVSAYGHKRPFEDLTKTEAERLSAVLRSDGCPSIIVTKQPSLVWSALNAEEIRERAEFWGKVFAWIGALLAALALAMAAISWALYVRHHYIITGTEDNRQAPYSVDESTGEIIQ